jgi:hypothetical protein
MRNALQDDNGNYSSMRILLFMLFAFVLFLYFDWRTALFVEVRKQVPDYQGITSLFTAMMAGFVALIAATIAKIIQKYIERK